MMRQRLRTNLIALLAISLTLTFVQTPLTPAVAAVAAVCQGEAAYPPDLPDCLDPVVAAQQEAATKAAADKLASDNAAAERAAAAAAVAAADRAAEELAAAKARAAQAAAYALAEEIRNNNLEKAAEVARVAKAKAIQDAIDAKDEADRAEATRKIKEGEEIAARQKLQDAQDAFDREQARLAKIIDDKKAEADALQVIALAKKKLADDAAAKFALESLELNRQIAIAEAERLAKETAKNASLNLTINALQAYVDAGGVALRVQNYQGSSQSLITSKQALLTQPKTFSNLKIQSEASTIFVTAEEIAREALGVAYRTAKAKSDEAIRQYNVADQAKKDADQAKKDAKAISDAVYDAFITAANARTAAANAAAAAATERKRLEDAIKIEETKVLAKQAEVAAAKIEESKKAAVLEVAISAKESTTSASTALDSAVSGGGDSVALQRSALALIRSVATATQAASDAAANAAAASERDATAQANAIRLRQESEAAAALADRNPSYSGPSVNSLELAAAQAEKEAKETERKAKEAKEAEEKASAEKKAAEDAAAKAKAAADKAAADSLAKEESKRNAARKQIAKDRAVSKKVIEKIQGDAQKNTEKITASATEIKSAYEVAVDQLAKVNKRVALLKEKENSALSNLNQIKSQLLTASSILQTATEKQAVAVAKLAEANYEIVKIQNEIEINKKAIVENDKKIKADQLNLADATRKFESLSAIAQSAANKAVESKKVADSAYKAWQSSLNTSKLTASLTFSDPIEVDNSQTSNAQSALSKLKEQYDLARKNYEIDKALADSALAEVALAKQVLAKAKSNLETRLVLRTTLRAKVQKLSTDLSAGKNELKAATAAKAVAVANYSKSENEYADVTAKFRQSEITYRDAKADTKYEFENAASQNDQVIALRKLSEFSKNSVKTAKDVLNSIQAEAKKLENSTIAGFLNDDRNLATISLPVFILGISVVSGVSIFAYLRRRQRKSKVSLIDRDILDNVIKKNLAKSKPKAKNKNGLKGNS